MTGDEEIQSAHARIGGFLARCSLLDYRTSQFIARWFCANDKMKFLSYTLQVLPFEEKRLVIEERMIEWHRSPEPLRETLDDISSVFERRELVRNGLLSRRKSGKLCIKSFSATRYLTETGEIDIVDVDMLPQWSERASEIADRLVALGSQLVDAAC